MEEADIHKERYKMPEEAEEQDEKPKMPTHIGCGGEVMVDEHLDPHCLKCEKELEPWEVGDEGSIRPKCYGQYPEEANVECTDDCTFRAECKSASGTREYPPELVTAVRKLDQQMKESGSSVTITSSEGKTARLGAGEFTPKGTGQVDLTGSEARYPIEHEVSTTVTHKFSSAIAKLSLSEKAYSKEMEKDRPDIVGLVKTKLTPARSVEQTQMAALWQEFADRIEEEM